MDEFEVLLILVYFCGIATLMGAGRPTIFAVPDGVGGGLLPKSYSDKCLA